MEIDLQGANEFLRTAMLEARIVVDAGIVDQYVQAAEITQDRFDGSGTVRSRQQIGANRAAGRAGLLQGGLQLLPGVVVLIHPNGNRTLARTTTGDGSTNTLSATGDQNDFALKLQVHVVPVSGCRIEQHCHRKSFSCRPGKHFSGSLR